MDFGRVYSQRLKNVSDNGNVVIQLTIPLTTVGAEFQNYQIQTFQLPVPMEQAEGTEGKRGFSQIVNFPPYFAMSLDSEYYMELTEQDLSWCKGLGGMPKICNPAKFMYSVRKRPSCSLALYTGNSTMMKHHCQTEYQELDRPKSEVYQLGTSSELLITSTEGQFIKHCQNGAQMVPIPACTLCIIQIPCGCILHSDQGQLPPLLQNCAERNSSSVIKYAVNMMVLGQVLNASQLTKYSGSVTFRKQPKYKLPPVELRRINSEGIVAWRQTAFELPQVTKLARQGKPMYATGGAYLSEPRSLIEELMQNDYALAAQAALAVMNMMTTALAVKSYQKGCSSSVIAAMALKAAHPGHALTLPPIPVNNHDQDSEIHKELENFWEDVKPTVCVIIVWVGYQATKWLVKAIYKYLSVRQIIISTSSCLSTAADEELTDVYFRVSDGQRTMYLYVYTIQVTESVVRLIQQQDKQMRFKSLAEWPTRIFSYPVRFTNNTCLLEIGGDMSCVRFPDKIFVPITQIRKFRRIMRNQYKIEVFIGQGRITKLRPNLVKSNDDITPDSSRCAEYLETTEKTDSIFLTGPAEAVNFTTFRGLINQIGRASCRERV